MTIKHDTGCRGDIMASGSEDTDIVNTKEEISQLRSHFQQKCRVIQSVGDFAYIISLQLAEQNVGLKFQLTVQYPHVIPGIIVQSRQLTDDCITQLTASLTEKAQQIAGQPMIQILVDSSLLWLQQNSVEKTEFLELKTKSLQHKGTKMKCKKHIGENIEPGKKPSMKTATDVISRILWDDNLPTQEFIVGYMDRFLGILEKPFSAFSWEDIASVDYYTLAIPKHRIHYFKYKTLKVWDKNQRLDLVFGSTGSKTTIIDVIANYEEVTCSKDNSHDVFRILNNSNFLCDDDFCEKSLRPNFFVALRITNDVIQKNVTSLQEAVLKTEPGYAECCIHPASLHVTLCMMHLDSTHQIAYVTTLLRSLRAELSEIVAGCHPLKVRKIDHFSHHVVYACIEAPAEFLSLVERLKLHFQGENLLVADQQGFIPHMTIMKITRQAIKHIGSNQIDPSLYQEYSNWNFGEQDISNLYLCSTEKLRQEDGFYVSPANLQL